MSEPKIPGYEALRRIGSGSSSTVYSAADPRHGREVVIKVLDKAILEGRTRAELVRELQVIGHLGGHPNIVELYNSGFTDDRCPYMVMPLYRNGTYNDRHPDEHAMSWPAVIDFGVKLAGAVEACHRQGVVHLDIKPSNVFIGPNDGQPVLGDFWISSLIDPEESITDQRLFALGYAAPEMLGGEPPAPLADIYSLGATLFYLMDGHAPFTGDNPEVVLRKILSSKPAPTVAAPIPQQLRTLVAQLLAKVPAERPLTALDVAKNLRSIQQAGGLELSPILVGLPISTAEAEPVVSQNFPAVSQTFTETNMPTPPDSGVIAVGPGATFSATYDASYSATYDVSSDTGLDWANEEPRVEHPKVLNVSSDSKSRLTLSLILASLVGIVLIVVTGVVIAVQQDERRTDAGGSSDDAATSAVDPGGPGTSIVGEAETSLVGKTQGGESFDAEIDAIEITVAPRWAGSVFKVWVDTGLGTDLIDGMEVAAGEVGVDFELEELTQPEALLRLQKGESPDFLVVNSAHDWFFSLVDGGYVASVELDKASLAPSAFAASTYDDDQYFYPFALRNVALIRNVDLVRDVPADFESLVIEAKALVDSGAVVKPLAIPQGMAYQYPLYTGAGGYLFGEGSNGELNPSDIGLDSAQSLEAARRFDDWVTDGLFTAGANSDSALDDFANGDAPFMINGPWVMDRLDGSGVEYEISPIPNIEDGKAVAPLVSVQAVFLSIGSARSGTVLDFVEDFFGSVEGQIKLNQSTRLPPTNIEALAIVGDTDNNQVGFYNAGADGHPTPNVSEMSFVWGPWDFAYENIFAGEASGQEAFTDAGAAIRQRIQDDG